jgi:hypothetical protein
MRAKFFDQKSEFYSALPRKRVCIKQFGCEFRRSINFDHRFASRFGGLAAFKFRFFYWGMRLGSGGFLFMKP